MMVSLSGTVKVWNIVRGVPALKAPASLLDGHVRGVVAGQNTGIYMTIEQTLDVLLASSIEIVAQRIYIKIQGVQNRYAEVHDFFSSVTK